jgi:hypothetical protein
MQAKACATKWFGISGLIGWRLFGNGTGFVWGFDFSEHNEEGDDHAIKRVAVGWAGDLGIERAGFDGPGAALAPASGAHLLDQAELDFIDGPEVADVLLQEIQEVLALFAVQNDTVGAQAMNDRVFRGTELFCRGGGPIREGAVGFRRLNCSK